MEDIGCLVVILLCVITPVLWIFGVLGVVVDALLYILLILLWLALVAGIVWLFLPYRGKENNKNSRNHKKLEDNS